MENKTTRAFLLACLVATGLYSEANASSYVEQLSPKAMEDLTVALVRSGKLQVMVLDNDGKRNVTLTVEDGRSLEIPENFEVQFEKPAADGPRPLIM